MTPPDADTPLLGWVYSKCNLRGHPVEEHWHPPVGQTPTLAAARSSPAPAGLDADVLADALTARHIQVAGGCSESHLDEARAIAAAYRGSR